MDLDGLLHCTLHIVLTCRAGIHYVYWERSPRDHEYGDIAEERGEFVGIHCGGGDNELEVITT